MSNENMATGHGLVPGTWRPLPTPTWLTEPFWDAAREGCLVVQRCTDCGEYVFRPHFACTRCLSDRLDWVQSKGTGIIDSFSIVKRPAFPELPAVYAVVSVKMHEGWFMMSNAIDCEVSDVKVDLPVRVAFRDVGGMSLPFVEPMPGVVTTRVAS